MTPPGLNLSPIPEPARLDNLSRAQLEARCLDLAKENATMVAAAKRSAERQLEQQRMKEELRTALTASGARVRNLTASLVIADEVIAEMEAERDGVTA